MTAYYEPGDNFDPIDACRAGTNVSFCTAADLVCTNLVENPYIELL